MGSLIVAALVLGSMGTAHAAPLLPPSFDDQLVASVGNPSALGFTPDGRMLIASLGGRLSLYKNGALLTAPALDISSKVCSDGERGLLGVAVDPAFATNNNIYLYYTFKKFGVCDSSGPNTPVNRVARFTLSSGDTVDPASEVVLVDNIPSPFGWHSGGDVQFGKDGYLYVSVGDGFCDYAGDSGCGSTNDASRDQSVLLGKILRLTRDGAIPPDNPFQGPSTERCNVTGRTEPPKKCRETYSWGLRNPWRIAFDPNAATTRFYINDVGQEFWEEIDLGQAGADYGWNLREGPCATNSTSDCGPPGPGITNPIHWYAHGTGCKAVTGGAFVPLGVWPSEYDGSYLYADLVCGKIFQLVPLGGGFAASEFATGFGTNSLVGMTFGPHNGGRALYYNTFNGPGSQVRRIVYTGQANRAPTASANAAPRFGSLPLTVSFNGAPSTDPDGDPLSYDWDFGDGSPHATTEATSHTYGSAGTYTVTLAVDDGRGGRATDTIRIDAGNNPPDPRIIAPGPGERFRVGEQITLTGSATDPEDGALPASALSWSAERFHTEHTHPYLPQTNGNDVPLTTPPPEDLYSTTTSYLVIKLTAIDSRGLSQTVTHNFHPRLVDLTFASRPAGLTLQIDGSGVTTARTVTSWEGFGVSVNAPYQSGAAQIWRFAAWSDGGARSHTIATPATATTYTAAFNLPYPIPTGAATTRVPLVPAFRECIAGQSRHGGTLSSQACSNPQLHSRVATLGRSTAPGTRVAFARIDVCSHALGATCAQLTNSQVPDVRLRGNSSDVVCASGAAHGVCPAGAGSDYDPTPGAGPYLQRLDSGTDSNSAFPSASATDSNVPCLPNPPNPPACVAGADMTALATIPDSTAGSPAIRVTSIFNDLPSANDPPDCGATTSCAATSIDQGFPVPVVCKATDSTALGSYCGVNTTANALVPGVVVGGKLAVVELGQIQVFDSGPDAVRSTSDDGLFAVQGIYVP